MPPATWANKLQKMSTSSHLKQRNPRGFHFNILPAMNHFHGPLCTSCWSRFKCRKSAFCLGLPAADSWDSCCQSPREPFLLPRLRGAGRQQQGGHSVCLQALFASNCLVPACPSATTEGTWDVLPDLSVGGSHRAHSLDRPQPLEAPMMVELQNEI